jgi:hypothetical protein
VILDEFVAITGYHRKHAIRVLNGGGSRAGPDRRGRPKTYTADVTRALVYVWEILDRPCSRRLQPVLGEMACVLGRHGRFPYPPETARLLARMSRATIDRLLQPRRHLHAQRPRWRTTKPGFALRESIPVRTFADWHEPKPGFVEIDLVVHCGQTSHGHYLHTLNVVDVATSWSECIALPRRGKRAVCDGINQLRDRLPFPLLGIDSDNDSAFINESLYNYCRLEEITFTRSRPYKKNDQAYIEQKNWSVVRRLIGYDRYEGARALSIMQAVYHDWRLYINFFQPVLKLLAKRRTGPKVTKRYDRARTPYQRVLESPHVSDADKQRLTELYLTLDPVVVRQRIDLNLDKLWQLAR